MRGGYRPGAGRPKGTKTTEKHGKPGITSDVIEGAATENIDPLTYMLKVMNDQRADKYRRDRMAVAAAPFVHRRKGEGAGKKEEKEGRAKAAGSGKFSPGRPPISLVK